MSCKHEIDDSKAKFIPGKGYMGPCIHCGKMLIHTRVIHPLSPAAEMRRRGHGKEHMSKKERLRLRRQEQEGKQNVDTTDKEKMV